VPAGSELNEGLGGNVNGEFSPVHTMTSDGMAFETNNFTEDLAFLPAKGKKKAADHNATHACPYWNVNRLFFLHREFNGPDFDCLRVLCVAEATVE